MPVRPLPSPKALAYATKRALGQMTYQIAVYRPDAPNWNPANGTYTAKSRAARVYTGKARVYQVKGPAVEQVGDEVIAMRQTMISIPASATPVPRRNDMVTITTSDDAEMTGKWFRILDVTLGGLGNPTRQMTVANAEPTQWTEP